MQLTETAWNDLLTAIVNRQVIPVIGDGMVHTPAALGSGLLSRWLAAELAAREGVQLPANEEPTLNRVVCEYLLRGHKRQRLYSQVTQILEEHADRLQPGQALCDLAAIGDLNLYLSATVDPLLQKALNQVRYGGEPRTQLAIYRPSAHGQEKDTPLRKEKLAKGDTLLAYLLGRPSTKPDYALWDEDLLEFILGLHADLQSDQMKNLAYDLQDNHLLFIGLHFSDWLTRFFVRVAEQRRLSETRETSRFLALNPASVDPSMVIFFDSLRQETQVWQCDPAAFAAELRQRWERRTGQSLAQATPTFTGSALPSRTMPSNSIFLSYAREDFDAVKRLKEELEARGCREVWFDLERLQAGENWRNALEDEVRRRCSVFVSCISHTTVAKIGVLHNERAWAADTAPQFGGGATFYVPVILDDLPPAGVRREPVTLFKENHAVIIHHPQDEKERTTVLDRLATRLQELQTQNRRA